MIFKGNVPDQEFMRSGHVACPGCGGALAMKLALKALGKKTMIVLPACCWSIIDGPFPYSSVTVPLGHTAFETGGSMASGVRAALDILGKKDITVMTWAGDGGTFDIGLQALSGAAERQENFIYVCYDNEAYMNTGIQRSSATPWGAWTTTTPARKGEPKKNIMDIMVAHKVAYAATASVAYPDDLVRKLRKAKSVTGTRFIHIFAPCLPGWKTLPDLSIKLARQAVQSRYFPLYEVENGIKYTLNLPDPQEPRNKPKSKVLSRPEILRQYIGVQGRFKGLSEEDIKNIEKNIDFSWEVLLNRCKIIKEK
ncbi:MAG: thiamine pyrophosphate-dependent enzyme [Candidatus Brocadiia bacterium]